jgi:hypothetical protein
MQDAMEMRETFHQGKKMRETTWIIIGCYYSFQTHDTLYYSNIDSSGLHIIASLVLLHCSTSRSMTIALPAK